jgi:D-serine deaminase-like pyridoxal phosphate-dependent protein
MVISLSQEHGIIKTSAQRMAELRRGDFVDVLPVHSCLAANLLPAFSTDGVALID